MAYNLNTPEMRKRLFETYNEVNKSIYGYGAIESKISFVDNLIIFNSRHNRVPILIAIEEKYGQLKQFVDYALFMEFKERFKESLLTNLDLPVKLILRDYDPNYLMAITVVVLRDDSSQKQ